MRLRSIIPILLLSVLGGCAVYGPVEPVAYQTYPVYASPGPVYAVPEPVYYGPPAFLHFGFSTGGGHRGHWRH